MSCKPRPLNLQVEAQGHRGCAGLMPENSIPGFIRALELGVRTLELDLVMNADSQLVVSHEPWMSEEYCQGSGGSEVEGRPSILNMTSADIEQYDCGSSPYSKFPDQVKTPASKPTLRDVIDAIEADGRFDLSNIKWNIEIKYRDEWVGKFCPSRKVYLDSFYDEVKALGISQKTILQCFDAQLLKMAHDRNAGVPLSYLVNNYKGLDRNLEELGFIPAYYSPNYRRVYPRMVKKAHEKGIEVLVWTVDKTDAMEKMMRFGVDGIITNYPDRLLSLLSKLRNENP